MASKKRAKTAKADLESGSAGFFGDLMPYGERAIVAAERVERTCLRVADGAMQVADNLTAGAGILSGLKNGLATIIGRPTERTVIEVIEERPNGHPPRRR